MGLRSRIAGLAASGPVPVFAVAGSGMRSAVQDLRLDPGVCVVDTPRAAAILLIAGPTTDADADALARLHDALPHPRATVAWQRDDGDPLPVLRTTFRDLLLGHRGSEPALLPDIDAVAWRDVGPYGQGGTGMTGGTPYGRPMAELGIDRDGLRLDILPVTLGPFFPRLPAGLVLEMKLAGDVVTDVEVVASLQSVPSRVGSASPFVRALSGPVPIAELELARARDHLRWLSDALIAQGMPALGRRALRLAHEVKGGDGDRVRAFAGQVRRSGVYRWSLPRGGGLSADRLSGLGLGPVARAAGLSEDVRLDDEGYRALGFAPYVTDADGPSGWWQVRLEEAARSLDLAGRAGVRSTTIVGRVESPRGRLAPGDSPTQRALALIPDLLIGLEWGDSIATLVGLDLDLDEAAAVAPPRTLLATA